MISSEKLFSREARFANECYSSAFRCIRIAQACRNSIKTDSFSALLEDGASSFFFFLHTSPCLRHDTSYTSVRLNHRTDQSIIFQEDDEEEVDDEVADFSLCEGTSN